MHISEIGFCSGHSASGVFVDEFARTTVPGLYAAGDMASVPHNYMLGAFTNGSVAGEHAMEFAEDDDFADFDAADIASERDRVLAPTRREDGIPPNQIEYKARRLVNDYLQPPKVTRKFELGAARLAEVREDMETGMMARNSHELLRALEAQSILDCADMAAARLAVPRGEPLGALSPAHRLPGARRRELVLPHAAQQEGRQHDQREARRGSVRRPDRRRGEGHLLPPARPRRRLMQLEA